MNILVTGGCGFIGSNLARAFVSAGHTVRVLDNFATGNQALVSDLPVEIVEADIRDTDAVEAALGGINLVYHLAAAGSVIDSVKAPEENFSSNAIGTFSVLQACLEAGIGQVVFSSTGGALMGDAPLPVTEASVPRPISPYGASKLAGEAYCSAFASAYDMNITALRFANVIGPSSWHKKGVVTAWCKALLNGEALNIYGDGEASRDFLYVDDLCRGLMMAGMAPSQGFRVFHVASGQETTVNQLLQGLLDVSGKSDQPVNYHPKRRGEVERNFASYDLIKRELGFEPQVSIHDALRKTWEWTRDYASTQ